ncbi:MAG TPA: zinc-ribbon domain-containing protein [Chthoniobacterales bacterium]
MKTESLTRCSACGRELLPNEWECGNCGRTARAKPSLIECPACGQQVSPNAASCPHCGETVKKQQTATGLFAALAIGLIVGLIIYYMVVSAF